MELFFAGSCNEILYIGVTRRRCQEKLLQITKKQSIKPLVLFRFNRSRTNKVGRFYLPVVLNCFEATADINQVIETLAFKIELNIIDQ